MTARVSTTVVMVRARRVAVMSSSLTQRRHAPQPDDAVLHPV